MAYRETSPSGEPRGTVLAVHGWPQSSYSWRTLLTAVAEAGWRGVAPDLLGFGDSPTDPPHTWERQVEALERLHARSASGRSSSSSTTGAGSSACAGPATTRGAPARWWSATRASSRDGRWHGMAQSLRTEGQGEQLVDGLTQDGFAALLGQTSRGIDATAAAEYWKGFTDADRRRATLELYRSGDFEKLEPYQGRLAALGVPALLLWGEDDAFAPVAGAHRFARELPGARVEVVPDSGHFVYDDDAPGDRRGGRAVLAEL